VSASGWEGSAALTAAASVADTAARPSFSRRRAPARVATPSRSASVPFSDTTATVSPAAPALGRRAPPRAAPPLGAGVERGAEEHEVGAEVPPDFRERVASERVRLGKREVDAHPGDVLA